MDGYATHIAPLVAAAISVDGDILELGCGDYSSPVLAEITKARGCKLVIHSSDPVWAKRFEDIAEVVIVDWSKWTPPVGNWGLVFLDSEEHAPQRLLKLSHLRNICKKIVMHDASQAAMCDNYQGIVNNFKSNVMYSRYEPATVVLEC